MKLKGIIDTDFVNYKKICMILECPSCNFKCDKECGRKVCQNLPLAHAPSHNIPINKIINMYRGNPLTEAIVLQGLEPFDTLDDTLNFIKEFRKVSNDDIVIFTGYQESEIKQILTILKKYDNIIIKFGRYIPDKESVFDDILGITLASPNQYAKRIEDC